MLSVHLVIPCYKESQRLPFFLPRLCEEMERLGGVNIMVVDDGSGPGEAAATRAYIDSIRSAHPCLRAMLELPENRGKGGAVYAGWEQHTGEEMLAFVDADGSCTAAETARLISLARATADSRNGETPLPALFASRVKMLGRTIERQLKRHLIGRIYATLSSTLLSIPVYDSQCGLKLVPRAAYEQVQSRLTVPGYAFDMDLLAALIDNGTHVIEVPIDWHEIPHGKVNLMIESLRMARDVWKIRQTRARLAPDRPRLSGGG